MQLTNQPNGEDDRTISMWRLSRKTPLQIAVINSDEVTVRFLLELGADVNYEGRCRYTPLQCSIRDGNKAIMNLLIEHGASFKMNSYGETPLMTALIYTRYNMFAQLKRAGAPIDFDYRELVKYDVSPHNPRYYAIIKDNQLVLRFLISIGANIHTADAYGTNLYLLARKQKLHRCYDFIRSSNSDDTFEHAASDVDSVESDHDV